MRTSIRFQAADPVGAAERLFMLSGPNPAIVDAVDLGPKRKPNNAHFDKEHLAHKSTPTIRRSCHLLTCLGVALGEPKFWISLLSIGSVSGLTSATWQAPFLKRETAGVKFLRAFLKAIDYAALAVAFVASATALGGAVMVALYNAAKFLLRGVGEA